MKWGEAKKLVLQEWDDWAPKNVPQGQQARGTDGLIRLSAEPTASPSPIPDEQGPMAEGPLTYAL
jgi:hypothetical protein